PESEAARVDVLVQRMHDPYDLRRRGCELRVVFEPDGIRQDLVDSNPLFVTESSRADQIVRIAGRFHRCAARAATARRRASHLRYRVRAEDPAAESQDWAAEQAAAGPDGRAGGRRKARFVGTVRSEEHTSELQSRENLVCRLLLEKKK